jgi:ecotin
MKILASAVMLLSASVAAAAADDLKAFPSAESGMVRYVLQLPEQPDESAYKVELIVGKTVLIDAQNQYFFGGRIEAEAIQGWGYTRYVVDKLGPMAGTLRAIDPDAPQVERFITLGGQPLLVRYNSRLPIVVYVPEGVEVRYRLWAAAPDAKRMEKG